MQMLGLAGIGDPIDSFAVDFAVQGGMPLPSDPPPAMSPPMSTGMSKAAIVWSLLSTASAVVSGYHGYKRNGSIGWGVGWFLLGGLFPVITPTIAFAQGYGRHK